MKRWATLIGIAAIAAWMVVGCTKPMADARIVRDVKYISRTYAANAVDVFDALKIVLDDDGWGIDAENRSVGTLTTSWHPATSDSHYIELFGQRDFSVTNSYYQLDINVAMLDGRTEVKVAARAKSLISNLKSSGIEENAVLDELGDVLRKGAPDITNLGINE